MRGRAGLCLLAVFFLLGASLAFPFETYVHPHEGFYSTDLYFKLEEGNNVMQTFLIPCDISDGIKCPYIKPCTSDSCPPQEGTLLDERAIEGSGKVSLQLSSSPGLYKICSRLVEPPFNYDCGGDNYFLLMDMDVVLQTRTEYVYVNITQLVEKREPQVSIYSLPTIITAGEEFSATVFFSNPGNESLAIRAYTFSFHEGGCVTGRCWDDYVELELGPGSFSELEFSNSFNFPGSFVFKARMKSGNSTYTDMMRVEVLPRREVSHRFVYNSTHVGYSIENRGDAEENFTIMSVNSNTSFLNFSMGPGEHGEHFFPREDGWLYLLNSRELIDSRAIWEHKEVSVGPTGFFVANPNDLNIPLVLVSLMALGVIVWKI